MSFMRKMRGAAQVGEIKDLVTFQNLHPADLQRVLTEQDGSGKTVLHHAAEGCGPNTTDIIAFLLNNGAEVNADSTSGGTPLADAT
jgi:ankyrin repeat protein